MAGTGMISGGEWAAWSLMFLAGSSASIAPPDFDLRRLRDARSCPHRSADDILVCARPSDADRQRLPNSDDRYPDEARLPRAKIGLGGGKSIGLRTEQADIGGAPSRRAMVTLRVPF